MPTPDPQVAVFVTAAVALHAEGGGVQRCTHEYLTVLRAAGYTLHHAAYEFEHRLWVRVARRLRPRPYRDAVPRGYAGEVRREVIAHNAGWVFLNQSEAAPLAIELADLRARGVRIALLSHGTDSADYLHVSRIRAAFHGEPVDSARNIRWLGATLFEEERQHSCVDVVLCLSETDRQQALWLGAPRAEALPRVVSSRPLDWYPVAGRIGTVATLTHEPNYEGVALLCHELAKHVTEPIQFRLVGRPAELGKRLAREFPFVHYLGSLTDSQLAEEAATWSVFVNPMFCFPRGCSTKLALPLEWCIPLATTHAGARGYEWDEALIPREETPAALAALTLRLALDPEASAARREAVGSLASRSPNLGDLAQRVRAALR